jgi:hypothetical protein
LQSHLFKPNKDVQFEPIKVKPTILTPFVPSADNSNDYIKYDLTGLYPNTGISQLTRSMRYIRKPSQSVVVEDLAAFSSQATFDTALTTLCDWSVVDNPKLSSSIYKAKGKFSCNKGKQVLFANIESNFNFNFKQEQFLEYYINFTRIGIRLTNPVAASQTARVTVTYTLN